MFVPQPKEIINKWKEKHGKEYFKNYRATHKEESKAYRKKYYLEHKEELKLKRKCQKKK